MRKKGATFHFCFRTKAIHWIWSHKVCIREMELSGWKTLKYVILENNWKYRRNCRLFIRPLSHKITGFILNRLCVCFIRIRCGFFISQNRHHYQVLYSEPQLVFYCKFYGAILWYVNPFGVGMLWLISLFYSENFPQSF